MLGLNFKKVYSTWVHRLKNSCGNLDFKLNIIIFYYQNGEATTPIHDAVPPIPLTPPRRRRAISRLNREMGSVRRQLNFSECSEVSA